MKELKTAITLRGDYFYCPLSLQVDVYWNCLTNCKNCYIRRLNRTWGDDLRPLDFPLFESKLEAALKNNNPKTPLAWALKQKKTIRLGNKTDPYQNVEKEYRLTSQVIQLLLKLDWSFVIQTKFLNNLINDISFLSHKKSLVSIMPIISPGMDKDWELFEGKITPSISERLRYIKDLLLVGFNLGVNGEPFIPGFHTEKDFEETIIKLKEVGVKSYNTYHLHFNDLVAKNLHSIGLDIEKIWHMNQDREWRKILIKLIQIAEKHNIILGCPDFVNSGKYQEISNTCCGLDVPNPCTFNMLNWKKDWLAGERNFNKILENSWDNVGDFSFGKSLIEGEEKNYYTLKDIKFEDDYELLGL